ncbi:MAG: GNAT family N-acetyltransferase [Agathobacter sp.]|nr:GNAT family N-acetyltransferase [Agathobacter sp.]
MAEIRMLQIEEIPQAVELAQGVFGFDLRQTITDPQTIRFFEEYTNLENLKNMVSGKKLYMWGVFEGAQLCAMSAMQPEGHITMLYVYPYFRKKKYARQLLDTMRRFAKQTLGLERVTACALPAWTASFFVHNGFWQLPLQPAATAQPGAGTTQNPAPTFVYVEAKTLNDVVYPTKKIPKAALATTIILTILAILAVIIGYFGLYGVDLL